MIGEKRGGREIEVSSSKFPRRRFLGDFGDVISASFTVRLESCSLPVDPDGAELEFANGQTAFTQKFPAQKGVDLYCQFWNSVKKCCLNPGMRVWACVLFLHLTPFKNAVSPRSGQLVSLIMPYCDRLVFQQFLDTMAEEVPRRKGKKVYLVLDNASWHKVKSFDWHHITPLYLPPCSPDLNPIERLWQHLKSHYLAGFITNRHEELDGKVEESIRALLQKPETLRSVCNTHSE